MQGATEGWEGGRMRAAAHVARPLRSVNGPTWYRNTPPSAKKGRMAALRVTARERAQPLPSQAHLKPNAVSPPSTSCTSRMPSATTGLPRTALPPTRARATTSPLSVFIQCR